MDREIISGMISKWILMIKLGLKILFTEDGMMDYT
jgi:hypothetical protein